MTTKTENRYRAGQQRGKGWAVREWSPDIDRVKVLCLECLHDRHWRCEIVGCECLKCLEDVEGVR